MGGPATETSPPVGLIAAGGVLPFAVADEIVARGQTPVLFALKGICDPKPLACFRHHWIGLVDCDRCRSAVLCVVVAVSREVSNHKIAASIDRGASNRIVSRILVTQRDWS